MSKYKQAISAKTGKAITKSSVDADKDTTYTRTVKRRHKFTVIFELIKDASAETDSDKKDKYLSSVKEKLSKLSPKEKAELVEIAGALFHEASDATDMTNKK